MSKIMFFLPVFTVLLACGHKEVVLPETPGIYDLATPVRLNPDTTKIWMSDYFLFPEKVKNVKTPAGLKAVWSDDRKELMLIREGNVEPMANLRLTYEGDVYDIPVINSTKKAVGFSFDPKGKNYRTVQLAGDMNAWNPANTELVYDDGMWKTTLYLSPGQYQYLLVLDGKKSTGPR